MESNNKKYLLGLMVLVFGFFVWRYVSNPLTVSVSGSGRVTVPASSARLTVSIVTTGDDVEKVIGEANTKVAAVRLAMVTGNMNEKEISQSQLQVTPLSAVVAGAKGYSVTVTLYGKTSEVMGVSSLISKLYKAGASVVSQPIIEVSNQQELENMALKQALAEAKENAKYLAKLNRKYLKMKPISIQQASSGNVAMSTKTEAGNNGQGTSSFEVAKAVSVVYWMW